MSRNRRYVTLTVLCLCPLLNVLAVSAEGEDIEKQLRSEYQGKVITLRHFYSGERLRFGADGILIGEAAVGPWTVDGQLQVESIHLRGRILKIEGRRLSMFFDADRNQFRDLSSVRKDERAAKQFTKVGDRGWKKTLAKQERIDIEIELVSETPAAREIFLTTNAIFLAPTESLAEVVPSFWHRYFKRQEGRTDDDRSLYAPLYRMKEGRVLEEGVLAPHSLSAPGPEYSEEARKAGYQGTVTMSFVVDTAGTPKDIQITQPSGLGLDEKSVEAVSAWKFEPGQKETRAVSVEMNVETSFRLY
jgi:TonB family protein